jgi:hypothetical protein
MRVISVIDANLPEFELNFLCDEPVEFARRMRYVALLVPQGEEMAFRQFEIDSDERTGLQRTRHDEL